MSATKISLHIPTEQYGFVAVEYETEGEIQYAEAAREYRLFQEAFRSGPGLPDKEWRAFLDNMLLNEPNHIEQYEQCSEEQKKIINEVKKALKRLEAREPKPLRDRNNE